MRIFHFEVVIGTGLVYCPIAPWDSLVTLPLLLLAGRCLGQNSSPKTAAWLAQLGECRSDEQEVAGSNPGRTNTQGL